MILRERNVINSFFNWENKRDDILVGIGDDAAILKMEGKTVVSCDALVESIHFDTDTDVELLGRKSLAVNLSDLAAMGARPKHALLSLTLPEVNRKWLAGFARGFRSMAEQHGVALVGGNMSSGSEIVVNVTVIGTCSDTVMMQNKVRENDDLWLSGEIGGADFELRHQTPARCGGRQHDPQPRIKLGLALVKLVDAAIDLSDSLCTSSLLLANSSGVGLEINGEAVALDSRIAKQPVALLDLKQAFTGGMDYELLFSASKKCREKVAALAIDGLRLSRIGKAVSGEGVKLNYQGCRYNLSEWEQSGFQHFGTAEEQSGGTLFELVKILQSHQVKVSVAESCTSGLLAATLGSIAGASNWLEGGIVAYSRDAKISQLGVSESVIDEFCIVSEEVAKEMALGVLRKFGKAGLGIGLTGWAGPETDETKQSVGTVCIACVLKYNSKLFFESSICNFQGNRIQIQRHAVKKSILMAYDLVQKQVGTTASTS